MCSFKTVTNNINTPVVVAHVYNTCSSIDVVSVNQSDSTELFKQQTQPQNMATVVLSNSHFFKYINEYIELHKACDTCTKILNLKKYVSYRLTKEKSLKYYFDEKFRNNLVKKISNPRKQLYIDLSECDGVIDVSVLQFVHYLDLSGCKNITDISPLANVNTLMFCGCKQITIANINTLKNVNTMFFSLPNITDIDDIVLEKTKVCYAMVGSKLHRILS